LSDIEAIRAEAKRREISRLAHFTPTRNLVHIATSGEGLKSTQMLLEEESSEFNQQDRLRLDGYPNHISCTIEYPNAYYYRSKQGSARGEDRIFPDWVCLLLSPKHLWAETTRLCPHNAAGGGGTQVAAGLSCFMSMFADEVEAPGNTWKREGHPRCCPTDAQAEVLVHRQVPLEDITGIVVGSDSKAADTYVMLRALKAPIDELPLIVCPEFYAPAKLSRILRAGRRPVEEAWHPPVDAGGETVDE
jgi:ssDNA thymidine ADP-ribosyltransferase, DarT